jgi:hypothetical protein
MATRPVWLGQLRNRAVQRRHCNCDILGRQPARCGRLAALVEDGIRAAARGLDVDAYGEIQFGTLAFASSSTWATPSWA